jgi:adenosylcobinamide-GDP ribazoletransferase
MATPEAGAFGVGSAAVLLLMRWGALASMRPAVLLLGGLWCLSRTLVAVVARTRPYARPVGGLADAFGGRTNWPALAGGALVAVALILGWRVVPGAAAAAGAVAGALLVVLLAERRLGGFTGDVLGAGAFVAETAGLIVAAARW